MMRSRHWLLLSLPLATLLAGCGDGPAGTGDTPPSSLTVNLGNVFFQSVHNGTMNPALDTVAVGGTVTWAWTQAGTHSVRFFDDALPESSALSESGSVFRAQFPTAGTYPYDCGIHGAVMSGTIVVK
jgi:plastocyanin